MKDLGTCAVIYCRVSSSKQVIEGNGLSSQEQRCRSFANAKGYRVIEVFPDEGVGGSKFKRPAMEKMIEFLKTRNDRTCVIIDDYKRWARDLDVYRSLMQIIKGCNAFIDSPAGQFEDSPTGRAMESMQAIFAALEREQNAEQVTNRMRARSEQGYSVVGRPPFGYKPGKVRGIPEEHRPASGIARQILEGYAYGAFKSFEDIARYINKQNLVRHNGKPIIYDGSHAQSLLEGCYYHAGLIRIKDKNKDGLITERFVKGLHKALISKVVYELVRARLEGKPVPKYRKDGDRYFPLRGHVLCSSCGKFMTAAFSSGRNGKYGYYQCKNGSCDLYNKNFRHDALHIEYEDLLKQLQPRTDVLETAIKILKEEWGSATEAARGIRQAALKRLRIINEMTSKLIYELTHNDNAEVKNAINLEIAKLSKEKQIVEIQLSHEEVEEEDFSAILDKLQDVLANPAGLWKSGSLALKQAIQEFTFPGGIILEKSRKFRNREKALPYRFIEAFDPQKKGLVDLSGIEPLTSCMPCKRSPS